MSWLEQLAAKGYRLTPQRRAIVAAIEAEQEPFAVETVFAKLRKSDPYLDRSTVYRTFRLLEEAGFLSHVHEVDGTRIYRLRGSQPPRMRLLCSRCQRIQWVDDLQGLSSLAQQLVERYGFHPDFTHYCISGTCRECARKGRTSDPSRFEVLNG